MWRSWSKGEEIQVLVTNLPRANDYAGNISALLDLGTEFTVPSDAKAEPIKKLMTMAVSER